MPIIAVTGTNGKTTTCRMINHILLSSGRKPGLVCTDGLYLNGQMISDGDNCTLKGHFDDLPFRIIMDFAHNPDGMRRLCEFIDQQDVPGRKLVAFSASVDRKDSTIKNIAKSLVGHFDFYFCKEFVSQRVIKPRNVAPILQRGLIEAGVDEKQTMVISNGKDVIFEIFETCEAGDLLVMLMGHVEKHQLPGYIREYAGKMDRRVKPGV